MSKPIRAGEDLLSGVAPLGAGRGRPRLLVRDEALAVAMKVINEEGLASLTLRRLAKELGVGSATVHTTFGGKEQLLQALADTVFAELPDPDTLQADDPFHALVDYIVAVHRMLVEHPAIAQLTVIRRMNNRALFRAHETIFELLGELDVHGQDAYDAYDALTNYVFGFSLNRISRQEFDRHETIAALPAEQFPALKQIAPLFEQRAPEEQLRANLHRLLAAYLP
ncbi:hypothetical protein GCM10023321_48900 [Pseudonocardia eucalypti]|uniref:HTH tetR-type domain-containing protein n=1 Tax=Pseudonocardia eucalypti TaxID=648755 RepID=A0ABP9QJ94_9PSEU|nr:AcrR family transcriptional regulator [Pseudonocardia eucalypti]